MKGIEEEKHMYARGGMGSGEYCILYIYFDFNFKNTISLIYICPKMAEMWTSNNLKIEYTKQNKRYLPRKKEWKIKECNSVMSTSCFGGTWNKEEVLKHEFVHLCCLFASRSILTFGICCIMQQLLSPCYPCFTNYPHGQPILGSGENSNLEDIHTWDNLYTIHLFTPWIIYTKMIGAFTLNKCMFY